MSKHKMKDTKSKIVTTTNLTAGQSNKAATDEDSRLLNLIKRLVSVIDDDDEQTTLTDSQLMNMLEKEFHIDLKNRIEFEIEVYMNVLKKHIKMWPYWDMFDNIIKDAKSRQQDINGILERECAKLKEYLLEALKVAEKQMEPYTLKLKEQMSKQSKENAEEQSKNTVAMEIHCSKAQLDVLIFNKPNRKQGNTIFNVVKGAAPSKISLEPLTLKHVLNWSQLQVHLCLPKIECLRRNANSIERNIVNLKLPESIAKCNQSHKLEMENIYRRKGPMNFHEPSQKYLISYLKELLQFVKKNRILKKNDFGIFNMVMQEFLLDIRRGPNLISASDMKFYSHKYKYVRYSSVEPPEHSEDVDDNNSDEVDADKFDLFLEEILTPSQLLTITLGSLQYHYNKSKELVFKADFDETDVRNHFSKAWVKFECMSCHKKFKDASSHTLLIQHFYDHHSNEGEWQCSGCKKKFKHSFLADSRWYHDCDSSD